jgi:PAS domain S-box-containing protein
VTIKNDESFTSEAYAPTGAEAQQETYYRQLIEQVEDHAIFVLDPNGVITTWNGGAERVLGYSAEEAIGQSAEMIFTLDDRARGVPEQEIKTALRQGRAADDRWHRRKDGSHFWANGAMSALHNEDGSLSGFGKILRDLTRQRLAAEERERLVGELEALNETLEQQVAARTYELLEALERLQKSERRFSSAFHAGPVAACITTLESDTFLEINESFLQLTGYSKDEVVGRSARELKMWSSRDNKQKLNLAEVEATLEKGSFRDLELQLETKTGEVRDILVSGEQIGLEEESGNLKLFYDISRRKQTEEQLHQAIQEVMQDTAWFSAQVLERLAKVRSGGKETILVTELTQRERQVLAHLAKGESNKQIAKALGLAAQTIRNHIASIYDKLGVHSRVEAVVWARERGILGP